MDSFQATMNKIPEIQLEPTQLKRLAAQQQLYSDAKVLHAVQIGLSVLVPPILVVLAVYFSVPPVYAASCGIIVALLNILWIPSRQQSLKQKAASIQELFDCDVLKLPRQELITSSPLEMETVEKYSSKYKRKYDKRKAKCKRETDDVSEPEKWYSKLENWYSTDVGKLPLHLGRIICQRSNCWWDAELRLRYANRALVVLSVLIVLTLFLGLIGNFTLAKLISTVAAPLMPAFVIGIREYKENNKYAVQLDELKKYVESLWDKALSNANPDELTRDSRKLQDEIYNHRRTSPLIFDWLYKHLRKEDEEVMNEAANVLVTKALKSLGK